MTDEQFIAKLYLHFFGRPAESGAVAHWKDRLGKGATRSDVVEMFMLSPEFIALEKQKQSGQLPSAGAAGKYLDEPRILSTLQAHVASQQRNTSEDKCLVGPQKDTSDVAVAAIAKLSAEVWGSREAVGRLNPRNPGLLNGLAQAFKKVIRRSLTWYTRSLQDFHYQVARSLEQQGNAISAIQRRLRRPDGETELAIQEQLSPYIEFFRGVSPVVDLGCGRGEFLFLLKESGIAAYGVDSDPSACEVARRRLLKIVDEDLFEHLRQLPDRTLGGVFSSRVIEFLPLHLQVELISLCSRKIKPGGVVVIETANPDSRRGFGRASCVDATHLRAVPSEMMKSALESNCFRDVKISVLAPVEGTLTPASKPSDFVDGTQRRAEVLLGASNRLMDSPAYAAVGWRI
jgi:SAM-dependent methyltransferase